MLAVILVEPTGKDTGWQPMEQHHRLLLDSR